jgi:glycosyltransferase involved in cell wall biosynthesis
MLKPIVFVSNASWHYGLPTNRQQLPKWLAKHTRVLYSSPFSASQAVLGRVSLRNYRSGLQEIQPDLYLFDNFQLLPVVRGQLGFIKRIDQRIIINAIQRHQRELRFRQPILWLYFPPSPEFLIGKLGESLTCYHCTDDHPGHAEMLGFDPAPVRKAEAELVRAVDLVFTTSRPLYEEKIRQNPNTFLMPNVAEIDRFAPVAEEKVSVARALKDIPRPIAGFVGAISAYKIDLELVEQTAEQLPNWSFVFVGPVGLGDGIQEASLPKSPNIYFLGQRAYDELPSYIAGFDVCTIPYHLNSYTAGVFPLKFWEYLASGKPVVTTALPALKDYYDNVAVVNSPESFAEALERAKNHGADPVLKRERIQLAASQSWERRATEIVTILEEYS